MPLDPATSDALLPTVGEVLASKYRIERSIGRGGMGAVYQARHAVLGHSVAIKFLLPEVATSPAAVTRFLDEARAAAQIGNDHVARVLDVEHLPGRGAFMVLEFLEGSDLESELANRGPLPVAEAAGYLLQALEGVAAAHARGIVHRDLKPANLFLTYRSDGTVFVKVLDFGISKVADRTQKVTATHALLGSPSYMSPEQVRDSKNVDARTDIWALGVCLFQLTTGVLPFDGENLVEVLVSVIERPPPVPSRLRPDLPAELDALVGKCLARQREARFQDAAELAEALARFAPETGRAAVERIRNTLHGIAPGAPPAAVGFGVVTHFPGLQPPPPVFSREGTAPAKPSHPSPPASAPASWSARPAPAPPQPASLGDDTGEDTGRSFDPRREGVGTEPDAASAPVGGRPGPVGLGDDDGEEPTAKRRDPRRDGLVPAAAASPASPAPALGDDGEEDTAKSRRPALSLAGAVRPEPPAAPLKASASAPAALGDDGEEEATTRSRDPLGLRKPAGKKSGTTKAGEKKTGSRPSALAPAPQPPGEGSVSKKAPVPGPHIEAETEIAPAVHRSSLPASPPAEAGALLQAETLLTPAVRRPSAPPAPTATPAPPPADLGKAETLLTPAQRRPPQPKVSDSLETRRIQPASAVPYSPDEPGPQPRRSPALLIFIVCLVLAAAIALGAFFAQRKPETSAPPSARSAPQPPAAAP